MRAPRTYVQPAEGKLCFLVSPRHTQPPSPKPPPQTTGVAHTNTLAQTHNVSHDSLTLLFFFSLLSYTHTRRLAVTSKVRTRKPATARRHVCPVFQKARRRRPNLSPSQPPRSHTGGKIWGLQLVLAGFLLLQGRQRGRAACDTLSQNSPALFLKAGNILFLFGVDATGGTLCVWPHVGAERSFRRSFMWWRPSIFRIHMFRESAVV